MYGTATMVVAGELDHCTASQSPQLDEALWKVEGDHLCLDLENLTFMDSSGIGVLLGRLEPLCSSGACSNVKNVQPPIEKLFRLTGLRA